MMAATVATTIAVGSIGTKLCLETFTITCAKTLELIGHLASNKHPSFEEFYTILDECDLKSKVSKIQQLITEFDEKEKTGYVFKQSIKMALNDVNQAIKNINDILNQVKSSKEYHEKLYFSTWRKTNCFMVIQSLRTANNLLNQRFADLEKFISICRYIE
jgi:hypothetical protein